MKYLILTLTLFVLSWKISTAQQNPLDELLFVANVNGIDALSSKEVVQIFRNGKSLWPGGEKVIIVLPSNKSDFAEVVAKNLYGGSVTSMQKFWLALVFQGRANPPVFVQTAEEVLSFIAKTPGAIGVLPKSEEYPTEKYFLKIR